MSHKVRRFLGCKTLSYSQHTTNEVFNMKKHMVKNSRVFLPFLIALGIAVLLSASSPCAGEDDLETLRARQKSELDALCEEYNKKARQIAGNPDGTVDTSKRGYDDLVKEYKAKKEAIQGKYKSMDTRGKMIKDVKNRYKDISTTGSDPKDVRADVDVYAKTDDAANALAKEWKKAGHIVKKCKTKYVNESIDATLWLPETKERSIAKLEDYDAFFTPGGKKKTGVWSEPSDPTGQVIDHEKKYIHAKVESDLKTQAKSVDKIGNEMGLKDTESGFYKQCEDLRNYKDPVEADIFDLGDSPEVQEQKIQKWQNQAEVQIEKAKKVAKKRSDTVRQAREELAKQMDQAGHPDAADKIRERIKKVENANKKAAEHNKKLRSQLHSQAKRTKKIPAGAEPGSIPSIESGTHPMLDEVKKLSNEIVISKGQGKVKEKGNLNAFKKATDYDLLATSDEISRELKKGIKENIENSKLHQKLKNKKAYKGMLEKHKEAYYQRAMKKRQDYLKKLKKGGQTKDLARVRHFFDESLKNQFDAFIILDGANILVHSLRVWQEEDVWEAMKVAGTEGTMLILVGTGFDALFRGSAYLAENAGPAVQEYAIRKAAQYKISEATTRLMGRALGTLGSSVLQGYMLYCIAETIQEIAEGGAELAKEGVISYSRIRDSKVKALYSNEADFADQYSFWEWIQQQGYKPKIEPNRKNLNLIFPSQFAVMAAVSRYELWYGERTYTRGWAFWKDESGLWNRITDLAMEDYRKSHKEARQNELAKATAEQLVYNAITDYYERKLNEEIEEEISITTSPFQLEIISLETREKELFPSHSGQFKVKYGVLGLPYSTIELQVKAIINSGEEVIKESEFQRIEDALIYFSMDEYGKEGVYTTSLQMPEEPGTYELKVIIEGKGYETLDEKPVTVKAEKTLSLTVKPVEERKLAAKPEKTEVLSGKWIDDTPETDYQTSDSESRAVLKVYPTKSDLTGNVINQSFDLVLTLPDLDLGSYKYVDYDATNKDIANIVNRLVPGIGKSSPLAVVYELPGQQEEVIIQDRILGWGTIVYDQRSLEKEKRKAAAEIEDLRGEIDRVKSGIPEWIQMQDKRIEKQEETVSYWESELNKAKSEDERQSLKDRIESEKKHLEKLKEQKSSAIAYFNKSMAHMNESISDIKQRVSQLSTEIREECQEFLNERGFWDLTGSEHFAFVDMSGPILYTGQLKGFVGKHSDGIGIELVFYTGIPHRVLAEPILFLPGNPSKLVSENDMLTIKLYRGNSTAGTVKLPLFDKETMKEIMLRFANEESDRWFLKLDYVKQRYSGLRSFRPETDELREIADKVEAIFDGFGWLTGEEFYRRVGFEKEYLDAVNFTEAQTQKPSYESVDRVKKKWDQLYGLAISRLDEFEVSVDRAFKNIMTRYLETPAKTGEVKDRAAITAEQAEQIVAQVVGSQSSKTEDVSKQQPGGHSPKTGGSQDNGQAWLQGILEDYKEEVRGSNQTSAPISAKGTPSGKEPDFDPNPEIERIFEEAEKVNLPNMLKDPYGYKRGVTKLSGYVDRLIQIVRDHKARINSKNLSKLYNLGENGIFRSYNALDLFRSYSIRGALMTAVQSVAPAIQDLYSKSRTLYKFSGGNDQAYINKLKENSKQGREERNKIMEDTERTIRDLQDEYNKTQ